MTIQLLVSVRDVPEALLAACGGADFIDLKEPGQGALGGLSVATIRAIVAALHGQRGGQDGGQASAPAPRRLPISATIGDVPMHALAEIQSRVRAVGACGVDYVKVGIERGPQAAAVLDWLAGCGFAVVPVFIADHGLDDALWRQALKLPFAGVMLDTADKLAGCLFDVMPPAALRLAVAQAREAGLMMGLAGALRLPHLDGLRALAPDFAGFRSAVCAGARSGDLDPARLAALALALHAPLAQKVSSSPPTRLAVSTP